MDKPSVLIIEQRGELAAQIMRAIEAAGCAAYVVTDPWDVFGAVQSADPCALVVSFEMAGGLGWLLAAAFIRLLPRLGLILYVSDPESDDVDLDIAEDLGLGDHLVPAEGIETWIGSALAGLGVRSKSNRAFSERRRRKRARGTPGAGRGIRLFDLVQKLEESAIRAGLLRHDNNLKRTARSLGLLPPTLRGKLKKMRGEAKVSGDRPSTPGSPPRPRPLASTPSRRKLAQGG